jgi:hypothetical protein
LLPEAVDDYVGGDNLVRFIDAFGGGVRAGGAEGDGVSGVCAGRSVEALYLGLSEPGAVEPPAGARSHRDVEAIWLLRSMKPDLKTIADFRRFRAVFRQFVLLCRRLRLYGREPLADGTRIKAVNDKDRNFTCSSLREYIRADEPLDDCLARLDASDLEDGATLSGLRTKNLAEKIEALGKKRGRLRGDAGSA